ncbi:MAG: tetraacyldisaccharide 4'-kinase [Pseudomonadota bacterium]
MDLWLQKLWYSGSPVGLLLVPLGWLFRGAVAARRWLFRRGWLASSHPGVPVVVVGNVTVGGTGKTPLVLWLVETLRRHGYQPGVISRGYGAVRLTEPRLVTADAPVEAVGDEPLLIARRTGAPVVVFPDRLAAARLLLTQGVDVIVADDGLQHYRLARDVELAVIDGERGLGNRRCLPAGPLREPPARLREVDAVVVNGGKKASGRIAMALEFGEARALHGEETRPLSSFRGQAVHALAGIGNPGRFFRQLEAAGLNVAGHAFPDHARIDAAALAFSDGAPVLMTEKDAVKCPPMSERRYWYVPVDARLGEADAAALLALLIARLGAPGQPAPAR